MLSPDKTSQVAFQAPDPTDKVPPTERDVKAMQEGVDWLSGIVARGSDGNDLPSYRIKVAGARAWYQNESHLINVGAALGTDVAIHEMGHGIEYKMPGALSAARAFLAYRCHGESPTKMNDVLGVKPGREGAYDDFEEGRKDRFNLAFNDTKTSAY